MAICAFRFRASHTVEYQRTRKHVIAQSITTSLGQENFYNIFKQKQSGQARKDSKLKFNDRIFQMKSRTRERRLFFFIVHFIRPTLQHYAAVEQRVFKTTPGVVHSFWQRLMLNTAKTTKEHLQKGFFRC